MSDTSELPPSHALKQWVEAQKALDHAIQHYLATTIVLRSSLECGVNPIEAQSVRQTLAKTWPNDPPIPDKHSKLAQAQPHLNRIRNSLLLVNTLPLELFLKIFRFAAFNTFHAQYRTPIPFSYQEDDHRHLLVLAHVCSHWRIILLNTPSFWSYFRLEPRYSLEAEYERSKEYFSRARGVPQSLSIYDYPDHKCLYPRHYNLINNIIGARLDQLTQLALLNFQSIQLIARTMTFLLNNGKPGVLRTLVIQMGREILHHVPIYTGNATFVAILGPIRTLSLRGITFAWDSPVYWNLLVLRIGSIPEVIAPTIGEMLGILSGCPLLHTLRLYGMEIRPSHLATALKSVYLNELEHLDLGLLPSESMNLLLPRIFPQHKNLTLRLSFPTWEVHDFTIIYPFLARTNVTRLFIDQCEGSESGSVLSQCVSALPNLHTLILDLSLRPGDTFVSGLIDYDESTTRYLPRCPQLHTVYFVTGSVSTGTIQQMVETHPMIRKLRFLACHVEPFEDVLHDWLRPFVEDVKFDPRLDIAALFDWYHLMI
ncbi:hypothetical protein ACGC1H_003457 [Rhizoctonia solani]|uniref:F-box domain-containing protein n=1 Tax=Rhizoctonia solani TaxID=456999 RepID=A0A8H3BY17_9AGAM|nr:unnamed protein product [Rhizoctonia solani]